MILGGIALILIGVLTVSDSTGDRCWICVAGGMTLVLAGILVFFV